MSTSYPLALYNFRVTVGSTSMSFTEVTGIAIAYEHVVYRHGLSFHEGEQIATFHHDAFAPISCKRGSLLDADPLFLHDWLRSKEVRPMEVHLCDATGKAVLAWRIARAVPVKLSAPSFSATSNDVAIDALDLQARGVSFDHP